MILPMNTLSISSSPNHLHLFPLCLNNYYYRRRTTPPPISSSPASTTITINTPGRGQQGWGDFCEKVSGEWDGFGADFSAEGHPIELPESVVPEAYREWEVRVFDWQTQCPTLAAANLNNFMYKNIKLLPTVGCEADAATRYTIQERNITLNQLQSDSDCAAFAYQSTGSYVALWRQSSSSSVLELEHCLIDPSDKESRVRIIQVILLTNENENLNLNLKLKSIKVFVEQWYGPFRNGDQLGGCAIRDSAFATTQPLNTSQLTGAIWKPLTRKVATFNTTTTCQELGGECVQQDESIIRYDGDHLVLLPKQLWCSVKRAEDDNETCCEVGWVLDKEGQVITSKCTFSSTGQLKEIAMTTETATLL